MSDFTIKWHGKAIPEVESEIIAELKDLMGDVPITEVMFHHYFFGGSSSDPCVYVWGEPGILNLEYQSEQSEQFIFDANEFPNLMDQIKKLREEQ